LWARSASIDEKASRKKIGYTRMALVFPLLPPRPNPWPAGR
jgi:hypothetical protein